MLCPDMEPFGTVQTAALIMMVMCVVLVGRSPYSVMMRSAEDLISRFETIF
ncbi:hypothetical protein IQ268_23195 [Oculatella sp. LEGE 06141]|uniref:hypothetical protein n=1 Tax=Oculatella sp. LEGE 06141 TaxID=1828648 RepID=UPI001880043D|nr:hypothetical protein [Oculatella sp. LEGE 06141]MBE9181474.1 hypothetical protein [Oculatella sp. LEGE 06141]